MPTRYYYVYILASQSRALYIGVTNDLRRRVYEHRHGVGNAFTKRYRIWRLVHFEAGLNPLSAIAREKQLKGWRREKKLDLVQRTNPDWKDLSEGWVC